MYIHSVSLRASVLNWDPNTREVNPNHGRAIEATLTQFYEDLMSMEIKKSRAFRVNIVDSEASMDWSLHCEGKRRKPEDMAISSFRDLVKPNVDSREGDWCVGVRKASKEKISIVSVYEIRGVYYGIWWNAGNFFPCFPINLFQKGDVILQEPQTPLDAKLMYVTEDRSNLQEPRLSLDAELVLVLKGHSNLQEPQIPLNVKLVSVTKGCGDLSGHSAEEIIAFAAKVSNPKGQKNFKRTPDLLRYCIKNAHWSIFETCTMGVEIKTSRAISAQILRHRSFSFQEFSQRYAEVQETVLVQARRQDQKNRQSSVDDMSQIDQDWFEEAQKLNNAKSLELYKEAVKRGVAKEQARFLLPMSTQTTLYMTGSVRSWIHYLELRTGNGTQLEHQEVAQSCKAIFVSEFPVISEALGWT